MDTIVGAGVTIGIGIIVIAAIFQLGKQGNPIVPAVAGGPNSAYNATLGALFK